MKLIIYPNDDDGVAVIHPSPNTKYTTEEIALKDVPKGKPYRIRLKYGLKKHGYSSITVTPNKIFVNFISCNNKYKFKIGFDGVQTTIQKFKRTNKKLVGCYKQSTKCENKNIGCIKSEEKKSKKKK